MYHSQDQETVLFGAAEMSSLLTFHASNFTNGNNHRPKPTPCKKEMS